MLSCFRAIGKEPPSKAATAREMRMGRVTGAIGHRLSLLSVSDVLLVPLSGTQLEAGGQVSQVR